MDYRKAFGERLRERRIIQGYEKQEDFGKAVGLSVQAISGYEKGDRIPNAEAIAKMADALGCTADYLTLKDNAPTHQAEDIAVALSLSPKAVAVLLDPIEQIEAEMAKDSVRFLNDEQRDDARVRFKRIVEMMILSGNLYAIAGSIEKFFAAKIISQRAKNLRTTGYIDFLERCNDGKEKTRAEATEAAHDVVRLYVEADDADLMMRGAKQRAIEAFEKLLDAFEMEQENGEY